MGGKLISFNFPTDEEKQAAVAFPAFIRAKNGKRQTQERRKRDEANGLDPDRPKRHKPAGPMAGSGAGPTAREPGAPRCATFAWSGVSWHAKKRRWQTRFRQKHIGYFVSEVGAAEAFDDEVRRVYTEQVADGTVSVELRGGPHGWYLAGRGKGKNRLMLVRDVVLRIMNLALRIMMDFVLKMMIWILH